MNENERNLLDENNDPLCAARGILRGLGLSLIIWLIIACGVVLLCVGN